MLTTRKIFDNMNSQEEWRNSIKSRRNNRNSYNRNDEKPVDERLFNKLTKIEERLTKFLLFEINSPLSDVLKEGTQAWCSYMKARDEFKIANEILLEYKKEDGLKDRINAIGQYIDSINEFDEGSFEAVKNMGYTNHISQLKKSFDKMTAHYNRLLEYTGDEYDFNNISMVKGFIRIECADISALKDIPDVYERFEEAKGNLEKGNKKLFGEISSTYKYLEENFDHSESVKALELCKEKCTKNEKALCDEIDKALLLYKLLSQVLSDEWFEQFRLSQENEISKITNNENLICYYKEKLNPLFDLAKENII